MFWGERGLLITRQHYITLYNIHLYTIYHHISCLRTNISIHIHPMSSGQSVSNASTSRRRAPAFVWAVCGSPSQCLSSAPSARPLKVSLIQFLQIMASLRFGCLAKPKKIYGPMSQCKVATGCSACKFSPLSRIAVASRSSLTAMLNSMFPHLLQFLSILYTSAIICPTPTYCNILQWHNVTYTFSHV